MDQKRPSIRRSTNVLIAVAALLTACFCFNVGWMLCAADEDPYWAGVIPAWALRAFAGIAAILAVWDAIPRPDRLALSPTSRSTAGTA